MTNPRCSRLVIGVIGFLGGISVIGRHFISAWVPGTFLVPMLGIVAILTGILHMSGLMRFQRTVNKRHTRSGKRSAHSRSAWVLSLSLRDLYRTTRCLR